MLQHSTPKEKQSTLKGSVSEPRREAFWSAVAIRHRFGIRAGNCLESSTDNRFLEPVGEVFFELGREYLWNSVAKPAWRV